MSSSVRLQTDRSMTADGAGPADEPIADLQTARQVAASALPAAQPKKCTPFSENTRADVRAFQGSTIDLASEGIKMAAKVGLASLGATAGTAAGAAAGTMAGGPVGAVIGGGGGGGAGAVFAWQTLGPHTDAAINAAATVAKDTADASIDLSEACVDKSEQASKAIAEYFK